MDDGSRHGSGLHLSVYAFSNRDVADKEGSPGQGEGVLVDNDPINLS